MAITQAMCTSFKVELLSAGHDFDVAGSAFKFALFRNTANIIGTFGAGTTNYSEMGSDEVVGTGYTIGGLSLTNIAAVSSGTTAFVDFNDISFVGVTLTTRGALIYNTSLANAAVCVLDFGSDKIVSIGNLDIVFPPPTAESAIIRLT